MPTSNRTCSVCGKRYYYCSSNSCESFDKPKWMALCCSDNCNDIFELTWKYYDLKSRNEVMPREEIEKIYSFDTSVITHPRVKADVDNMIAELNNTGKSVIVQAEPPVIQTTNALNETSKASMPTNSDIGKTKGIIFSNSVSTTKPVVKTKKR